MRLLVLALATAAFLLLPGPANVRAPWPSVVTLQAAAPAYGTSSAIVGVASGNITLVAPASIADNDILIAWFASDDDVDITLAGWTTIGDVTKGGGAGIHGKALYKRAASESGNYTFTHTAGSTTNGQMFRISGAITSGSPISGTVKTAFGSSTSYNSGSMTPVDDNNLCIMLAMNDNEAASYSSQAGGSLTWTERIDNGDAVTAFKRLMVATAPQPTAASLTATSTISASVPWVAIFFALKEAAGGAASPKRLMTLGSGLR